MGKKRIQSATQFGKIFRPGLHQVRLNGQHPTCTSRNRIGAAPRVGLAARLGARSDQSRGTAFKHFFRDGVVVLYRQSKSPKGRDRHEGRRFTCGSGGKARTAGIVPASSFDLGGQDAFQRMPFSALVGGQFCFGDQIILAEFDQGLEGVTPSPPTDVVGLRKDMRHARMVHGLDQEGAGSLQRRIPLFGPGIFRRHREQSLHHDGGPPHPVPNGIFQTLRSSHPVDPPVGPFDVVFLTVQQEIHRRSANLHQINCSQQQQRNHHGS